MLRRIYFSTKSFLSSILFPRICVGCGSDIRWICDECLKTIDIIKQPFCPECRRVTEMGEFCENCRSRYDLDGIFICANFEDGVLKEAVHHFKYNYISDSGGILGKLLSGKLISVRQKDKNKIIPDFDVVVPVPLHKKRLRQRGFNQAEVLARVICRDTRPCVSTGDKMVLDNKILVRKKYTIPQAELGREKRLENLKDVFEFVGIDSYQSLRTIQDKNILLVDDITTTGATLEECAKVLKKNGAKKVWGIVLAKGK